MRNRSRILASIAAGVWLCLTPGRVEAAQPVPLQLQDAPLELQIQGINEAANRSLQEKIAVGKDRYRKRLRLRKELVTVMRIRAEQQGGLAAVTPAVSTFHEDLVQRGSSNTGFLMLLAMCGLAASYMYLRRTRSDSSR